MAIKTHDYDNHERQTNCKRIEIMKDVKNPWLVWTRLPGIQKNQSPQDKHWLCNDCCEEICTGQAAQENAAGSLQRGILGDSDNNGEVTKERKNGYSFMLRLRQIDISFM